NRAPAGARPTPGTRRAKRAPPARRPRPFSYRSSRAPLSQDKGSAGLARGTPSRHCAGLPAAPAIHSIAAMNDSRASAPATALIDAIRPEIKMLPESGIVEVVNYARTKKDLVQLWVGE